VSTAVLRLKRGHDRARVHPWIFKGDVADVSDRVEPGGVVSVVDPGGRFVGRGLFNPRPGLCCRLLTWTDEAIDAIVAWFRRRPERPAAALVPIIGHFECRDACMARVRAQPAQLRP